MPFTSDTSEKPIAVGTLSYFRAKLQDKLYSLIVRELLSLKDRLTRTVLARRIGRRPEQITRWLASPGNWTLDTISDLCVAMGVELHFTLIRRVQITRPVGVTGRLEDEIEVTDEMIEAGVLKLYDYDPRFSNEEDIVEDIFRRMLSLRKPG